MKNQMEIQNWLKALSGEEALFISVRFQNPPKTKYALCRRCKPIICKLFRELLGRHWRKTYFKRFTLIGFKEIGRSRLNMHAHFIIAITEQKPSLSEITQALKSLSTRIKMDVWDSETDKRENPKLYANDIMVTEIYSGGVFSYITKEIKVEGSRIETDDIILDNDLIS